MKIPDLRNIDFTNWRTIAKSLDKWNEDQHPPFKIVALSERRGETQVDICRVAVDESGKPVAMEQERLEQTTILVSPEAFKPEKASR
jgi:hypothetical protein